MEASMADLAGKRLGQYELIEQIGQGGMAAVYRATQTAIGREVAVKVLPAQFLLEPTFLERFTREVQVISRLEHPRILPVYDFGEEDGLPFIVMRYLPDGTLSDRIHAAPGRMALDEVTRLVGQIAEGLDYAHREGIIHRDIKPSNVLLDKEGNAYLADFGIAKVSEVTVQLTRTGMAVGTPAYMAPETYHGAEPTAAVDIYALGVTLYQMLTGEPPFRADSPPHYMLLHLNEPVPDARAKRPDLPDGVQPVIETAMAKASEERYASAGALAEALASAAGEVAQADAPPPAPGSGLAPPAPPPTPVHGVVPPTDKLSKSQVAAQRRRRGVKPLLLIRVVVSVGALVIVSGVLAWIRVTNWPWSSVVVDEPTTTPMPTPCDLGTPGCPVMSNDQWTPVNVIVNSVEMVLVPTGCFVIGDDGEGVEWCFAEPFWIDVTEVTNAEYGVASELCAEYSSAGGQPRICVDSFEASAHCESRGARLPTEAEWEYAARGPDGLVYPWGDDFVADNVVYARGETAPVGSKPGGASWVRALDMSGNVWEWVTSPRVLRGGSWEDVSTYILRADTRGRADPGDTGLNVGFRCARDY
jgi:serine/threonine-protein kinase